MPGGSRERRIRSAAALSAPGPSLHRVGGIGPRRLGHCHGYSTILAAPLLLVPIVHVALGPVLRSSMLRAPWKTARAAQAGSVETPLQAAEQRPFRTPGRQARRTMASAGGTTGHEGGITMQSEGTERSSSRRVRLSQSGCSARHLADSAWYICWSISWPSKTYAQAASSSRLTTRNNTKGSTCRCLDHCR